MFIYIYIYMTKCFFLCWYSIPNKFGYWTISRHPTLFIMFFYNKSFYSYLWNLVLEQIFDSLLTFINRYLQDSASHTVKSLKTVCFCWYILCQFFLLSYVFISYFCLVFLLVSLKSMGIQHRWYILIHFLT